MTAAIFPFDFLGEQAYLLTAIGLGGLFGFALERAGFGSPRKLAAQFYLHDMTVFKVMFTAILVAMVGFHAGAALGLVDVSRMWINPTFLWAQIAGGFVLGIGFILSGLCPGTAIVSAVSGRIDALAALAGVFVGTFAFALLVDWIPAVERLYGAGAHGVSVLPQLLHVPAPWLALALVLGAVAAFFGVETLERRVQPRRGAPNSAPRPAGRRDKLALAGTLAAVALVAGLAPRPRPEPAGPDLASIEPMQLAEAILRHAADLVVVDMRAGAAAAKRIPGASQVALEDAATWIEANGSGATVVLVTERGELQSIPAAWPRAPRYRLLRGGFAAWEQEVLTPRPAAGSDDLAAAARHNAVAAWFSGAELEAAPRSAPPPPAAAAGAPKKKKAGGC
jgi:uncharacterized membrane protein YedE/YeeE